MLSLQQTSGHAVGLNHGLLVSCHSCLFSFCRHHQLNHHNLALQVLDLWFGFFFFLFGCKPCPFLSPLQPACNILFFRSGTVFWDLGYESHAWVKIDEEVEQRGVTVTRTKYKWTQKMQVATLLRSHKNRVMLHWFIRPMIHQFLTAITAWYAFYSLWLVQSFWPAGQVCFPLSSLPTLHSVWKGRHCYKKYTLWLCFCSRRD